MARARRGMIRFEDTQRRIDDTLFGKSVHASSLDLALGKSRVKTESHTPFWYRSIATVLHLSGALRMSKNRQWIEFEQSHNSVFQERKLKFARTIDAENRESLPPRRPRANNDATRLQEIAYLSEGKADKKWIRS